MNLKRLLGGREAPSQSISSEDLEVLQRAEQRGQTIRQFFSTPVGKIIEERINQDQEDAKAEMLSVDPYDITQIKKIQEKAQLARKVEIYLGEALIEAEQAIIILQQNRN